MRRFDVLTKFSKAIDDSVNFMSLFAERTFVILVSVIIRQVLRSKQRFYRNMILILNCAEQRRDPHYLSAVILNALQRTDNGFSGRSRSNQQKDVFAPNTFEYYHGKSSDRWC